MKKLVLITTISTLFFACSKSSSTPPIVGKWKFTSAKIDTNNSGTFSYTMSFDTANIFATFNSDGTLTTMSTNPNMGMGTTKSKWALGSNNTVITVSDSVGGNPKTHTITFSGSTFVVLDSMTSSSGSTITYYKEQLTYTKQ